MAIKRKPKKKKRAKSMAELTKNFEQDFGHKAIYGTEEDFNGALKKVVSPKGK